jgi:exopolysaccharide production protein ExoQ
LCSVGVLGVARQATLRDLCLITLAVSTILVVNSVGTEIALGTFHPCSPGYRFAGTLHPNVQAPYCATMALAAGFLASHAKRAHILLWTLCAIGVALLALTKSRTACGAAAVGLLTYGSLTVPWPKRVLVGTAILGACCAVALAVSLLGGDIERQMTSVALIGRQEEADSLSGRIPLWAKLTPYLQDHFLLGHGYQTFWSPQRIESFSEACEWAVPDGHSAYLDAILDLGIIGAAIYVATVVTGIGGLRRRILAGDDYGCGFLFTLLVYRAASALLESAGAVPTSFVPFMMVCGLVHFGCCGQPGALLASEKARRALPPEADGPGLRDVRQGVTTVGARYRR